MTGDELQQLRSLYETRFAEKGRDVRSLGWNTENDQHLRFRILSEIADLSRCSICDVGCGFADLKPYLDQRFPGVEYFGVDISPSFLTEARRTYPGVEFWEGDILQETFDRKFDYFLLSGALSFRIQDNLSFTERMLGKMFRLANKGVAANFLTSYVNFVREHNYHHDPADVFRIARALTPWVALRHDYPLWEFTVYLYREARG